MACKSEREMLRIRQCVDIPSTAYENSGTCNRQTKSENKANVLIMIKHNFRLKKNTN